MALGIAGQVIKQSPTSNAVERIVSEWCSNGWIASGIAAVRELPGRAAVWAERPADLDPRLTAGLDHLGILRLYSHQRASFEALAAGKDLVVATPTASGKSLCFNLSVFNTLLRDPTARALYLYPTKALARDQVAGLRALASACGATDLGAAVFDGDTPGDHRRRARHARVLATNPDMLHSGILPHHASWAAFFAGLRYVVVDELHTCSGRFGAGVANVLRRLRRIAAFHGAAPQMVATSATIGNPGELGERVLGRPVDVIAESGAPVAPRTFVVYNPPVIDRALGLRASYLKAAERVTRDLLDAGIPTLVFTRSRRAVEILVRYLRDDSDLGGAVRGYRGGYLPDRRREVESLLKSGGARAVIATSALELGIDVGGLDAVVMAGWPGSRAAAWQRAGRAGRRGAPSVIVLVACSEPLDQYLCADPDYLFGGAPEAARLDPDSLAVLVPHIKCAAFELPFAEWETFGPLAMDETREVLCSLVERGLLHGPSSDGRYHWVADAYPAQGVPLRGLSDENFAVIDRNGDHVIAEVDFRDAAQQLHENAIYPLEGQLYEVVRLDWSAHKAFVRRVDVDYTTDALTRTRVRVLERLEYDPCSHTGYGDVHLVDQVVGFKKIKLHTHENVGYGEVSLPPFELHTRAVWFDPLVPDSGRLVGAWRAVAADGVGGAAYALKHVAMLLVLCGGADLGRTVSEPASSNHLGRIYLYDSLPGGSGFASHLFSERVALLERALRLIDACVCDHGCPACVGPVIPGASIVSANEPWSSTKAGARRVIRDLLNRAMTGEAV